MTTFKKILFPTDFSKGADHALEQALRLVDIEEGEVIVQHVVSSYFEKHPHWASLFDIHEMQKYMDMYVETEVERVTPAEDRGAVRFRNVISEGKPAPEIVKLAEEEHVDLIIMGPAKSVVTAAVIRAARRPVLSVPYVNGDGGLKKTSKILVTTDFSAQSKKVVDYAFDLKRRLGCELDLLYVIELSNAIKFGIRQGHFRDAPSKMREWGENQLQNLTPHEFVSDPSVRRVVEEGPAGDKIADFVQRHDPDLVVLGAHGYGPVEKHFVGKTVDKLLPRLARPVLTVQI